MLRVNQVAPDTSQGEIPYCFAWGVKGFSQVYQKLLWMVRGVKKLGVPPKKVEKKRVIDEGGKTDKKEEPDLSRGRDDMVTFSSG